MDSDDFGVIDIGDLMAEPIPPETVEEAYRRGFVQAVEMLAFGGSPISQENAEEWYWRCRKWRWSYRKNPTIVFPPRPEDCGAG